jgi:hypothetical protein
MSNKLIVYSVVNVNPGQHYRLYDREGTLVYCGPNLQTVMDDKIRNEEIAGSPIPEIFNCLEADPKIEIVYTHDSFEGWKDLNGEEYTPEIESKYIEEWLLRAITLDYEYPASSIFNLHDSKHATSIIKNSMKHYLPKTLADFSKHKGYIYFNHHQFGFGPDMVSEIRVGVDPPILKGNFGSIKIIDTPDSVLNFGCEVVILGEKEVVQDILRKAGLKIK